MCSHTDQRKLKMNGDWPSGKRPSAGQMITVQKRCMSGEVRLTYSGRILRAGRDCLSLKTQWTETASYEMFSMRKGQPVHEYFHRGCWYAIIKLLDKKSNLKGWYCDISSAPELTEDKDAWFIKYVDLAVDLFVTPQRKIAVLDKKEFENRVLPHLNTREILKCSQAMTHILNMVHWEVEPFEIDRRHH